MKSIPDETGTFLERPYYEPEELDADSEEMVCAYFRKRHKALTFPISTDDLTNLVEQHVDHLDLFADLTGADGCTEFPEETRPIVKISSLLSTDRRREPRLRTTLIHELGHVR